MRLRHAKIGHEKRHRLARHRWSSVSVNRQLVTRDPVFGQRLGDEPLRLEGQAFGDVPLNMEMKLEVWDSPNSAGIVTDAVRCCKLALNNGIGGQIDGPSSYLMKSPHNQRPDDEAREATEKFIAKYAGKTVKSTPGRPQGPGAREGERPSRSFSDALGHHALS